MPIDIELVLGIIKKLFTKSDLYFDVCQNKLKEAHPSTFAKVQAFQGEVTGEKVLQAIEKVASKFENLIYCEQEMKALWSKLSQLGFNEEDFEAFFEAHLTAIEMALPENWDGPLEDEWNLLFGFTKETLKDSTDIFGGTMAVNENEHLNSDPGPQAQSSSPEVSENKNLEVHTEESPAASAEEPSLDSPLVETSEDSAEPQESLVESPPAEVVAETEENELTSNETSTPEEDLSAEPLVETMSDPTGSEVENPEPQEETLKPSPETPSPIEEKTNSKAAHFFVDIRTMVDEVIEKQEWEIPEELKQEVRDYIESKSQQILTEKLQIYIQKSLQEQLSKQFKNQKEENVA